MKEFDLPSGAKLRVDMCDYSTSKKLLSAFLSEMKQNKINPQDEIDANFYKDIFCSCFTSTLIESAMKDCFKKALYNNNPITDELFENEKSREDYLQICFHVIEVNIGPFLKGLLQKLGLPSLEGMNQT